MVSAQKQLLAWKITRIVYDLLLDEISKEEFDKKIEQLKKTGLSECERFWATTEDAMRKVEAETVL